MECWRFLGIKVSKFYFFLWFWWALRLTLCSITIAALLSALVTLFFYVNHGMLELKNETLVALLQIFFFCFAIAWSFTLLLALFRSLKYIFNSCYGGYKFQLMSCPKEGESKIINIIGYGDLVKVFRRWLMLIIWLVGTQMILALVFMKLLFFEMAVFQWFNIYLLYFFILVAGYFSFILFASRCKRVRVSKC